MIWLFNRSILLNRTYEKSSYRINDFFNNEKETLFIFYDYIILASFKFEKEQRKVIK